MKNLFIFVALVFLASFSSAYNVCGPGFYDNLSIRTLDANLRPIEGAEVKVYYQLDFSTSKGFVNTTPKYTNSTGEVYFVIHNIETNPTKVKCNFDVYANYAGNHVKESFNIDDHPSLLDINFNLYYLTLRITDQYNFPLPGANVSIGSLNLIANEKGEIMAHVKPGTQKAFIKYGDGKIEYSAVVKNDTYKTVGINLYPLTIFVMDDKGDPLQANATIGSNQYVTDSFGKIHVEKLATATPFVQVKYKNVQKDIDADLTIQTKYNIIFDLTPPEINEVKTLVTGSTIKLVIYASDPGPYASGVDTNGVIAKYRVSDSESWRDISVYLSGKNQYVAELPTQPPDTIVRFFVEVKDGDGNRKSVEGQFLAVAPAPVQNQTTQNNINDTSPPINQPKQESEFPLLYIVAGFIILAIVIYALYKYRFGGASGGESTESL